MKSKLLIGSMMVLTGSLLGADANPKEEVGNAARKLGDQPNYSWKSTTESANQGGGGGGGGGRFGAGPTEGRTEKGGFTHLNMVRGENTFEALMNGGKAALKTADGWQSLAEVTGGDAGGGQGGQRNPARFLGRTVQNFKAPAVEAQELVGKVKELKASEGAFAGDLTEDGAKQLLTANRRGPAGAEAPAPTNPRGSAKFWVKDGVLSKYQYRVQGTMSFNGNEMDIDRTTTVEIKDVGTTKVEAPEDAKKKLN